MKKSPSKSRSNTFVWVSVSVVIIALILLLVRAYRENFDWRTVYVDMIQKDEIISQMKTDLLRSVEAEKNAVLADTDEASQAFAGQSISAVQAVEDNFRKLTQLVETGRFTNEITGLEGFGKCWAEFRRIDQRLLDFAVQNTNLKAARLSFTKGKETLTRFESSLAEMVARKSMSPDVYQIANLAHEAITAAFDIYSLQGPHIIGTSDQEMDKIETSMSQSESKVKQSLQALESIVSPEGSAELKKAEAAFSDFQAVEKEIIQLSRQNTNIRSMELSLGVKRKITAECLESLSALQHTVKDKASFKATR